MFKNLNKQQKIMLSFFLAVPVLSSVISSIHLVDFFNLSNSLWISIILSITFEIGSIASFLALGILKKANRTMLWSVFIIMLLMQVIGNVYYGFHFINEKLILDPNWLNTANEFFDSFGIFKEDVKIFTSLLIGVPIPLIALFFLKSTIDYLDTNIDVENTKQPQENIKRKEPSKVPILQNN